MDQVRGHCIISFHTIKTSFYKPLLAIRKNAGLRHLCVSLYIYCFKLKTTYNTRYSNKPQVISAWHIFILSNKFNALHGISMNVRHTGTRLLFQTTCRTWSCRWASFWSFSRYHCHVLSDTADPHPGEMCYTWFKWAHGVCLMNSDVNKPILQKARSTCKSFISLVSFWADGNLTKIYFSGILRFIVPMTTMLPG